MLHKELPQSIRVLLVDDDEEDFIITRDLLSDIEHCYFDLDWVSNYSQALDVIGLLEHDVCLVDYRLGAATGVDLLNEIDATNSPTPIILLTGQGDRQVDLESMKSGASDYLSKARLDPDLLERSIRYSIDRKRAQREKDDLIDKLQSAMNEINTLGGMLPICASCKNIRDDNGYWSAVELYISERSDAEFSHSMCPACVAEWYPDAPKNSTQSVA